MGSVTNFPYGVSSYGMPVMPQVGFGLDAIPRTPIYVHSGTGKNAFSDDEVIDPSTPCATIDNAVGRCVASKCDTIIVLPGHAENISTATSLVCDVAGIRIVGLGVGSLRPTLTWTATAGIVSITAADVVFKNFLCKGAIDNIVKGFSLAATADGCQLHDIEMLDGAANKEFLIAILIAAGCDDVVINRFRFHGLAGGASSCIDCAGAANRLRLLNSFILGDFSAQIVDLAAAASLDIEIAHNILQNIDTTAGLGVGVHNSSTGFAHHNMVANLKDAVEGITGTGLAYFENYMTNALGASGIILPGVDT